VQKNIKKDAKKALVYTGEKCYRRLKKKCKHDLRNRIKMQKHINQTCNRRMLNLFIRMKKFQYKAQPQQPIKNVGVKRNWHFKLRVHTPLLFRNLFRRLRYQARMKFHHGRFGFLGGVQHHQHHRFGRFGFGRFGLGRFGFLRKIHQEQQHQQEVHQRFLNANF